jgi:hypothetical protein
MWLQEVCENQAIMSDKRKNRKSRDLSACVGRHDVAGPDMVLDKGLSCKITYKGVPFQTWRRPQLMHDDNNLEIVLGFASAPAVRHVLVRRITLIPEIGLFHASVGRNLHDPFLDS